MKILRENPRNYGYIYETDKLIIDYYDIFFASYDTHIVKAEKTVKSKITKEETYWRAWFDLPEDLANDLKIDDLLSNWPPKDPELQARFDEWLEERLLSEDEWMNDSIATYSSQYHSLPMISFLLLENINKALTYNAGLPKTIEDFLKEATKVLKKEDYEFEYLEVYSEITKDEEGNDKKEFIVENDEIIKLGNTSKIKLFNRLSQQGWTLDFKDDDGHYIFKRSSQIDMPTFFGNDYEKSMFLEFNKLQLNDNSVKFLQEIGIFTVEDLLNKFESINDLHDSLEIIIANNNKINKNLVKKDIQAGIDRLRYIFQEKKGISLQEAVFDGYVAPIEILELSVRGYNCLKRAQIHIVADLLEYSPEELLEIKGMDRKAAAIICRNLEKKLNLFLKFK
jgi:hypothetical protein